jgi:hypothetical protein
MRNKVLLWHRLDGCAVIASDAIAAGVSFLLMLLLAMLLSGCALVGQFGALT